MSKKPLVNALVALLYIAVVSVVLFYGPKIMGSPQEDTIFAPIAMIALLTLSVAMMGYLFVYQPVQMYLDGEKKEAAKLFLQTVGIFAVLTVVALIVAFVL